MRVDDLFCDGKSQAGSRCVRRSLIVRLIELLEDSRQLFGRNPAPAVAHLHAARRRPTGSIVSSIVPPRGVNLKAFDSRLPSTSLMRS